MTSSDTQRSRKASRDDARTLPDDSRAAGEASAQTLADVERLMGQMREANERLIVAAVHAQNQSDEAHAEAARARADLEDLLRDANERLATAAAHAQRMAEEAAARQEEYRRLSSRLLTLQDEERRRLALDLHDSTAQCLAALIMNLDVVQRSVKVLDIQDEGHGLRDHAEDRDRTPLPATLGVGIQGMRERIRQLGGTFDIEFTERGSTVRACVPWNQDSR